MIDRIYFDFEGAKVTLITEDNESSQSLRHPKDKAYKKTLALLQKLLTDGKVSRTWIQEVLGMEYKSDVSHRLQFTKEILTSPESITAEFFYIAVTDNEYYELKTKRLCDIEIKESEYYKDIANNPTNTDTIPEKRSST